MNFKRRKYKVSRNLIFLILILTLLDGALRKWVFPSLSTPLLMLKDVAVLILYLNIFQINAWPKKNMMNYFYVFLVLITIQSLLQVVTRGLPLFPIIYGIRNYIFLLPLPFVMQKVLDWKDVQTIIKIVLFLAIPSAILVLLQYISPPTAFINRSVGDDEAQRIFVVVQNVVRPYGFFSFTNGQTLYCGALLVLYFMNQSVQKEQKAVKNQILSIAILLSITINIVTSGSRSAYLLTVLIFASYLFSNVISLNKKSGQQGLLFGIIAAVVASVFVSIYFQKNIDQIVERQNIANRVEGGFIERLARDYLFLYFDLSDIPILGYGAGVFTAAMQGGNSLAIFYKENELLRILYECGYIVGALFILFRLHLASYLVKIALRDFRKTKNVTLFILLSHIMYQILVGQITYNNTAMYFTWFFTGVVLVVNKEFTLERLKKNDN